MQPLLYEGKTHVLIIPDRELRVGDLPIYIRPDGVYVIHRLISVGDDYCYTRGDNCISGEKIPREWILGKVSEIYRGKRTIKVTDKGYLAYVRIWCAIFPLRSIIMKVRNKLWRIIKAA